MPMSGANGGLLGADNTPVAGSASATQITSTGCFNASSPTGTVIVVAGGGGAGSNGGGGGGGVVIVECHPLPGSAIPVTIGAGGAGSAGQSGTTGADSVFGSDTPITAKGGGGGGGSNSAPHKGKNGGSGGGGGDDGSSDAGFTVTTNHGCTRAGFAGGKGDHGTGGGGGGAGDSGGKRGKGGMGACLLPLGVPKCMVDNGFAGGGGGGYDSSVGDESCGRNAVLVDDACNARARPANRNAPTGINYSGFRGGMGGGGDAAVKTPFGNATTPNCMGSAATAGQANTGGGGGGNNGDGAIAGGSGVIIVVECGAATIKNGIYNVKEHYAAVRASRWV